MQSQNPINPIFNIEFESLYVREGLLKIDEHFLQFLQDYSTLQNFAPPSSSQNLFQQYLAAKNNPTILSDKEQSELLIAVGGVLEEFLALFFNIKVANQELQKEHQRLANLYVAGRLFVERRVAKKFKTKESISSWGPVDLAFLNNYPAGNGFAIDYELPLANKIVAYLQLRP